ncbi:MAG: ribonuclease HI family protein [bacterium]|nr:ribonuclease HI family protein [bacterium]
MDILYINTDGGSRGNPGPMAIGVVFYNSDGVVIHQYKQCIGEGPNNEAEYRAIIQALKILKKSDWFISNNLAEKEVICRLDSQLVVEQINGRYKVKKDHLGKFIAEIKELLSDINFKISFTYVPREQNKLADKLVNEALDEQK